jgi:hypothetical protein
MKFREKLIVSVSSEPGAVVGKTVAVVARLNKRGKQYYVRYDYRYLSVRSRRIKEASYKRSAVAITKAAVAAQRIKIAPPAPKEEEKKKQYWRVLKAYKLASSASDYSLFTIYAYAYFDRHPNINENEQVESYIENVRNNVIYQAFRRPGKIYDRFHDEFGASDVREVDADEIPQGIVFGDIHSYVLFRKDVPIDVSEAGSLSEFMHSKYTGAYYGVIGHAGHY